ncbi:GCG_CRPN prefix-to-repeats domain-containing protein [Rhizobium panacihumi]|uniref:GCG_CRPN prefix-to-repeats domain-containing protein n=1 Tax=Rhizobium panacihumi TaxID=2008450 RepID=UPI003D7B394B
MRGLILSAGLILGTVFGSGANAMPIGQPAAPNTSAVQSVDYACGRGFYLSPRGICRPHRPPPRYERRWDRREHWRDRREWRERRERREWREHRRNRDYREW